MVKNKLLAVIITCMIAVTPLSAALASPSPSPGSSSTSTVTSPDGTTRTINSDGSAVTSPGPTSRAAQDDEDSEDYDENESYDEEENTDEDDTTSSKRTTSSQGSTSSRTSDDDQAGDNDTGMGTAARLDAGITLEDPTLTPPEMEYAKAALLMDMPSGRVLYSKNLDDRKYPASTTKIMTGILALEYGHMDETVTATYEALKSITLEDSHMGILIGEELTMEQLVKGMLVYSANDAANVIAIQVAGSINAFVDLMNQKAQELGMIDTHFSNPCGIHDNNHYTTTRDLAILSKYAMKNEQFREIVKMPIYKIPPTNKYTSERILVNTNLFLGTSRSTLHYYPPAIGIKTGHTSQSGYCLVSAAAYNDIELLAIVMDCGSNDEIDQGNSYVDAKTLFDFGFDNYANQPIAKVGDIVADSRVYEAKNDMRVAVTVESDISALISGKEGGAEGIQTDISLPEQIIAPITKGDILGTVNYSYNGVPLGQTNLIATNDVERNMFLHVFHLIMHVITSPFFFVPVIILILVIIFANHRKKKIARQKRIQQLKRNRQYNLPRTPDRNATRNERIDRETKGSNSRYRK